MKKVNQNGFSVIEVTVFILIVGLIGAAAYYVGTKKHDDHRAVVAPSTSQRSQASKDPYKSWNSYTLRYEKLSFKYPSSWKLSDSSGTVNLTPNTDQVYLSNDSGFGFSINDGAKPGGDPTPLDTPNAIKIGFSEQKDFIVFTHPRVHLEGDKQDANSVAGFILLTNPDDLYSWPADKYVHGDPSINNGGDNMLIWAGYNRGKFFSSTSEAMQDQEFKNAKLVLESAHY
jgi:hypothetical protein